jgi:hypothetical protein
MYKRLLRLQRISGSRDHLHIMLGNARRRSKKRGAPCSIVIEDIAELMVDTCPILGFHLEVGDGNWQNSPSMDRIDNTKGYEKGNVIIVSRLANVIKNQATPSQIKKVADFYMKLYAEKGITV